MVLLDDLYAEIDPIDTPEALQAALNDPEQRWYGLRRLRALAAAGLIAATWNPLLHPRGHDGKFIEQFGFVRWFDKSGTWRSGYVTDIDGTTGVITVKGQGGDYFSFADPKKLYARPKPKARMKLPNPGSGSTAPGFTKVGKQGGSNPGGFYEVTSAVNAVAGSSDSPDISAGHKLHQRLRPLSDSHNVERVNDWHSFTEGAGTSALVPPEIDVFQVPRIDGTPDRYDIVVRGPGNQWYRVPTGGTMVTDDLYAPELAVPLDDVFGAAGSTRRLQVFHDDNVFGFTLNPTVDPDELAVAVRKAASDMPLEGDKYYVKSMKDEKRVRNEALANDFYELLGVAVPEVSIGEDPNTIASKLIGPHDDFNPNNPAHRKAAQDGFVFDAWLANWDAVGQGFDNMQITDDGTAWRVDAGGALLYRAMESSGPKGSMFGPDVGELTSLRNPNLNPQAAAVYGGISDEQLQQQGRLLQSISPYQITELADTYGLPEVGATLIARRKSILDQLHIAPPEPEPVPDVPDVVYNPAEGVSQPGTPPQTAVKNWTWQLSNTPKVTLSSSNISQPSVIEKNVHFQHGELWVYESGYQDQGSAAEFKARNLFTDEVRTLHVYPGDQVLANYSTSSANLEDLVDDLNVQRDLAIAEIVASQDGRSMTEVLDDDNIKGGLPANFAPYETNLTGIDGLSVLIDNGYVDESWPLRNTWNGEIYEVVNVGFGQITLRASGTGLEIKLDENGFNGAGPWMAAGNDTTAALYQARLHPAPDISQADATKAKGVIAETQTTGPDSTGWNDITDDTPTGPTGMDAMANQMFNILNDPNISDADKDAAGKEYLHYVNADKAGETPPPTPTFDKLVSGQQAAADLPEGTPQPWTPEQAEAAAVNNAASHDIQIADDSPLVKSLGPQTAIFTSTVAGPDAKAELEKLIGSNVVVLPQKTYDNPDGPFTLAAANGLGTVESVNYNTYGELWVGIARGDGSYINVRVATNAPNKVIIPVATDPIPQKVTLKGNGQIVRGGDVVGEWAKVGYYGDYTATIYGDYSLTGKPLYVKTTKKNQTNTAIGGLLVPKAAPVPKAKKAAVAKTEADIAALEAKYTAEFTPEVTAEAQAKFTALTPAPPGAPTLNDGTEAVKGNWVFSTKTGRWGQIVVAVPTYEKAKNKVRVKWQDTDGTWKQSHWLKTDLVSAPGQNQPPPALASKLVTMPNGSKAGPGSIVTVPSGTTFIVLDTTVDGKIKVLNSDGNIQWGDASKAVNVVNVTEPGVTMSDAEVQAQVDAYVNATVAEKVAAALANDLAPPAPKKKSAPSVVTYPGPGGALVKQDPAWAEERTKKGLKNLKDGNAPKVGQIVRHNDGTRYIVVEIGKEWTSAKNSVRVIPEAGSGGSTKSRSVTTLVIDHEAMLTDSDGNPLPRVTGLVGGAALPDGAVIWRRDSEVNMGYDPDLKQYRYKKVSTYYAIGPDGTTYDLATGNQISKYYVQSALSGTTRVAYVDKAGGDQQITLTTKPHGKYGDVYTDAFIIHDAGTDPMSLLAGVPQAPKDPKTPAPPIPSTNTAVGTLSTGQSIIAGEQYLTPQGELMTVKVVTPDSAGNVFQALVKSEVDGDEYWVGDAELVAMKLAVPSTGTGFQAVKPGDTIHTTGGETFTVLNTSTSYDLTTGGTTIDAVLVDDEHGGQYWFSEQQLGGGYTINTSPGHGQESLTLNDGTEITLGQQVQVAGAPDPGTVIGVVDDTITVQYADGTVDYADKSDLLPTTTGISPPTPPPPVTPTPPGAPSDVDLANADLVYTGTIGVELPHAAITKAAAGATIVPQPSGKVGALDQKPVSLPHEAVNSVMDAVNKAKARAAQNQATKQKQWVSTFALADSDAIDDMLIEVGLTRDTKGDELIEVRFRLNNEQSKTTRGKLLGASGVQYGDWETIPYNPKDLTIGDQVSIYQSAHEGTAGMLKPAKTADTVPNAIVSGGPYLVGKNAAGTYDVYRFQVTFPNGEQGYVQMEDRGAPSIVTYQWNPTKERISTGGSKSLSGDAVADGWQVAHSSIRWERAGSGEKVEHYADGVKKMPTPSHTKDVSGSGVVLRRGHNGAEITMATSGDRNNLDGEVSIRVAADDPDAQAKLSAAMELVGIPVDKQAPPTKAQLTKMALNKVAKQFAPTYQRGVNTDATEGNPQSALALVDKAVGAKLGRPVTMDDISLRVAPDGRVQVLVSEDIAKAIVGSNNAKYYQTKFRSDSDELTVISALSGESTGLMSSVDRFRNGIFTTGESSAADHSYESAQRVYFTARTAGSTYGGVTWMIADPVAVHRHTDYHWQRGDSMGERPTNNLGWLTLAGAGGLTGSSGRNELMLKRRFEPELWGRVTMDEYKRQRVIDELHKRGVTHAPNGMLLEDFIISSALNGSGMAAPEWGDEVKLTELVEVTPAPAPAVP